MTERPDGNIGAQQNSKFLENLQDLNKECYLQNLLFYIKSNIIRAPLEMLSVLYLAALGVIFTTLIFEEKLSSPQIVYMIFSPLAFSAIICILYSIGAAIFILKWAYKKQKEITEKFNNASLEIKLEEMYFAVDKSFSTIMFYLHFAGVFLYFVSSLFIAEYLPRIDTRFSNDSFRTYLIAFGFFSGITWNIYGYQSDKRLDWSKIFKRLKEINVSTNKKIYDKKLRVYLTSIIMQLSCCFFLSVFSIIFLIKVDPNLFSEIDNGDLASCSAFLTLLVSVISLYVRTSYNMFFSRKYKNSVIFPNWCDFFPEDTKERTYRYLHLIHYCPKTLRTDCSCVKQHHSPL